MTLKREKAGAFSLFLGFWAFGFGFWFFVFWFCFSLLRPQDLSKLA
jgi:hypothetical protein